MRSLPLQFCGRLARRAGPAGCVQLIAAAIAGKAESIGTLRHLDGRCGRSDRCHVSADSALAVSAASPASRRDARCVFVSIVATCVVIDVRRHGAYAPYRFQARHQRHETLPMRRWFPASHRRGELPHHTAWRAAPRVCVDPMNNPLHFCNLLFSRIVFRPHQARSLRTTLGG